MRAWLAPPAPTWSLRGGRGSLKTPLSPLATKHESAPKSANRRSTAASWAYLVRGKGAGRTKRAERCRRWRAPPLSYPEPEPEPNRNQVPRHPNANPNPTTAAPWAYQASSGMPSAYCTSLPRSGKCVNHASAAGERKRCTSSTLSQRTSDASVMSSTRSGASRTTSCANERSKGAKSGQLGRLIREDPAARRSVAVCKEVS